ncbi:MAG TPA: hypothetical protein DCL76_04540 [Chloroflexi bacterium]|nr:hypothetical protein [Chloroflexota bacterium]
MNFRQDYQDDRVWCMEQILKYEGFLDSRIYACADKCVSDGLTTDSKDVIKAWEDWKVRFPSNYPINNRL